MSYYYNNSPYYGGGPTGNASSAAGSSVGSNASSNGFGNYAGFGNSMFAMGGPSGISGGGASVGAGSGNGGSPDMGISAASAMAAMAAAHGGRVTSYSRPSSVSPEMAAAYPVVGDMSSKARFNASRGFEAEDDLEFCPALVPRNQQHYLHNSGNGHLHHHNHLGNSSLTTIDYSDKSPQQSHNYLNASALTGSPQSSSGSGASTRVRKVIQIVDPNTGLKVSSPPTPNKGS